MEIDPISPEIKEKDDLLLLDKIRDDFLGLKTKYNIANGEETRRIYLDSTASTLMMGIAYRTSEKFLKLLHGVSPTGMALVLLSKVAQLDCPLKNLIFKKI